MNEAFRTFTPDDAVAAAANALTRECGEPVAVADIAVLSGAERRNHIIRAVARYADECLPVIVKATRAAKYDTTSENAVVSGGLARELAASLLLAGCGTATPRLLTYDVEAGVIVQADCGDAPLFSSRLLSGAAEAARAAVIDYADILGRLHAATACCYQRYVAVVHRVYPQARVPRAIGETWLTGTIRIGPTHLGGSLPDAEVELLFDSMRDPGPWLALVHGDPCPDNVLLTENGPIPLDFEFAAPGHALIDATYWRLGFPTCWCAGRVPDDVAQEAEDAYRAVIATAIPAAADTDAFRREFAVCMFVRLFGSLQWHLQKALDGDARWGIATQRQRLLWHLDAASDAAMRANAFPQLRRLTQDWRAQLADRWPEATALPLYPVFATAPEG